jgi:hypothetical protein
MGLTVDIGHLLEDGDLPTKNLRRSCSALRIVRFIEYGGPLKRLQGRETLIECKHHPHRRACLGLMWVTKRNDNLLAVFCSRCHKVEAIISGWEATVWAGGPMQPLPMTED